MGFIYDIKYKFSRKSAENRFSQHPSSGSSQASSFVRARTVPARLNESGVGCPCARPARCSGAKDQAQYTGPEQGRMGKCKWISYDSVRLILDSPQFGEKLYLPPSPSLYPNASPLYPNSPTPNPVYFLALILYMYLFVLIVFSSYLIIFGRYLAIVSL